ncbi:hypothetical protein KX729_09160 [Rhizobium sp. XQZ8]|uniref:hypothetical protein n=1 Tax=Rhizobium populisoli TaxID=2859785 RepID=UPI001CA56B50|nr:hypothetical protein [Rhizobium populisoli]MBW6421607.1 hypothetical protein [Rhizobium populisoli]
MARKIDTAVEFTSELNRCLPWLIEALHRAQEQIDFKDILKGLVEREYQLWTTENAAAITSIITWEGKQVCCLFMIGGVKGKSLKEILAARSILEPYAKSKGCSGLLGKGRAQWLQALTRIGFQEIQHVGDTDNIYFKGI